MSKPIDLHVLNGDFALDVWKKCGFSGNSLVWKEIDLEGPLPETDDLHVFRTARAEYLSHFAELSDIDVGEWFDKKFCGEHIPTLAQTLDYMKSADVEAKIDNVVQKFTPEQIDKTFDIIEKHGSDKVGLTCSDLELLEKYATRFPTAPLHYDGPVSEEALDKLATFSAGHKTVVWMRLDNKATSWNTTPPVSDEYSALVRGRGFLLGVWILHTEEEMQQALAFHADIVETTGGIKP